MFEQGGQGSVEIIVELVEWFYSTYRGWGMGSGGRGFHREEPPNSRQPPGSKIAGNFFWWYNHFYKAKIQTLRENDRSILRTFKKNLDAVSPCDSALARSSSQTFFRQQPISDPPMVRLLLPGSGRVPADVVQKRTPSPWSRSFAMLRYCSSISTPIPFLRRR